MLTPVLLKAWIFELKFNRFRSFNKERNAILQALLQENERLRSECDRNKDELENENEGRRLWHSKFKNLDATFKASRPFVVAILDGDGVLFKDESYQAVKDGGSLAAQSLETGIRNYVGTTLAIEGGYDLVVHIYVNLAGFGNKLVK